jgi:hypothetical protein
MFARVFIVLSLLALAGCSMSGLLPDWMSEDVAGPEPPSYRFLIAIKLREIVGDTSKLGPLEISSPTRVNSLRGASWMVCIKSSSALLLPRYYAVFFQRAQIADSRLSVLIDQCELQSYRSFDWVAEAASTPPLSSVPPLR